MDKNKVEASLAACPTTWDEYEGLTHQEAAVAFAKKLHFGVLMFPQTFEIVTRWAGTEDPLFRVDVVFDDEPSKVIMRR